MKIVFCGTIVPEEFDIKLEHLSPAANRFQINFIYELLQKENDVRALSYIGFPYEKEYKIQIANSKTLKIDIDYVWKDGHIIKSVIKYMKFLKASIKENPVVFAYNPLYAWIFLPIMYKKTVLILADFSEPESYHGVVQKMYAGIMQHHIKKYKYVIGLSAETRKFLTKKQDFLCIEGGMKREIFNLFIHPVYQEGQKIRILYSGILNEVTGVDLLLRALELLKNEDFELWITGRGELETQVLRRMEKDKRLRFYGYLDYAEYIKLLNKSHVLINPRNMNLPENQNNFPSKIIEYIGTGRVILSTKFIGNERFEDNICFFDSNAAAIAQGIEKCLEIYTRLYTSTYQKNRIFAEEFFWDVQIEKILQRLEAEG